jgi:CHAT domain-containing protein
MIGEALGQAPSARPANGLLTVGGPDFSGFRVTARLRKLADLPNLEWARTESNAVAASFRSQAEPVRQLLSGQATERQFRAAIAECCPGCLHIATHTVGPDASPDGATALALCPGPQSAGADNDGLLEISEIYTLPLRRCELAVLSACRTITGRAMPRETAMSTSRAFLAAGTHRVVASHWAVDDRAGCEFVRCFLDRVAHCWQSNQPCNYAAAVQTARQRLREDARWSDPYFWSSFVLFGAAD